MLRDLKTVLNLTVLVAGLGYFVDLYDITLFGVVRVASLKAIGVNDAHDILESGLFIYNSQMIGMMVGGLLWGVIADRKGRLAVLFSSILIYSLANFANAFVTSTAQYALCRFIGGLGLAGELGSAITLVAETLPQDKRGLGTAFVATLGMLGIVAAALVGKLLTWKMAYFSGAAMGVALLFSRFQLAESTIFSKIEDKPHAKRGDLRLLLVPHRLKRYCAAILVGIPIYFTTGILFTFAPELTAGLNVTGTVTAADAILFGSIGLTIGDILSGLLSQKWRSRKKAIAAGLISGFLLMLCYGLLTGLSAQTIYWLSFAIGLSVGYWAVLITMAAEQFGTNIRGTVATSVPNFVRGSAVLASGAFAALKTPLSVPYAALLVGSVCFGLALIALFTLDETFAKDLNFTEGDL